MVNQPPASGQSLSSELSFIDALKFPFDDKDWLKKIAIGAGLTLTIIGGIPVTGYCVRVARRVMRAEPGLPEWDDFGGDITRGLYILAGNIIHFFPIIILACIVAGLQIAVGSAAGGSSGSFNRNAADSSAFASIALSLCSLPVFLVIGIPLFVINLSAIARFAATNQFSAFTDFSTLIADARKNMRATLFLLIDVWLYWLIMGLVINIGSTLCCLPGLAASAMASMGLYYIAGRWGLKLGLTA